MLPKEILKQIGKTVAEANLAYHHTQETLNAVLEVCGSDEIQLIDPVELKENLFVRGFKKRENAWRVMLDISGFETHSKFYNENTLILNLPALLIILTKLGEGKYTTKVK